MGKRGEESLSKNPSILHFRTHNCCFHLRNSPVPGRGVAYCAGDANSGERLKPERLFFFFSDGDALFMCGFESKNITIKDAL